MCFLLESIYGLCCFFYLVMVCNYFWIVTYPMTRHQLVTSIFVFFFLQWNLEWGFMVNLSNIFIITHTIYPLFWQWTFQLCIVEVWTFQFLYDYNIASHQRDLVILHGCIHRFVSPVILLWSDPFRSSITMPSFYCQSMLVEFSHVPHMPQGQISNTWQTSYVRILWSTF